MTNFDPHNPTVHASKLYARGTSDNDNLNTGVSDISNLHLSAVAVSAVFFMEFPPKPTTGSFFREKSLPQFYLRFNLTIGLLKIYLLTLTA
jgi:hypothetical protein